MARKDFFLSEDDAQTLGDINYMRRSVKVRHTFPKNLKNPNGFAIEKEVSSSQDITFNSSNNFRSESSSATASSNMNTTNSNPEPSFTKSSNQSTSMDMFRNMARNIGKR